MSKGADALRMLVWSSALFVQAGTAIESASFWEDVKKLQEEDLERLPSERTYRKDGWAREKLCRLTEIDASFRKYSKIWRGPIFNPWMVAHRLGELGLRHGESFPLGEPGSVRDTCCISIRVCVMAENSKKVVPAELAEDAEVVRALFRGRCVIHTQPL